MSARSRPVFYDPLGRRARATNAVVILTTLVILLGAGALLFALVAPPFLPGLANQPPNHHELRRATEAPLLGSPEHPFNQTRDRRLPTSAKGVARLAFFANHDERSLVSLKRHAAELNGIVPDWLSLADTWGGIRQTNVEREQEVRDWLRAWAPHVEVYPLLVSGLPAFETAAVFATPTARTKLVESIAAYLRRHAFAGVAISLPQLPSTSHAHYVFFLSELRRKIFREDRKVVVVVPSNDGVSRYQELARAADYLLLCSFDATYDRRSAGPIASQNWFEVQLDARIRDTHPSKLIVGVGSFAYDWAGFEPGRQISVQAAWNLLDQASASLKFDLQSLNPGFRYLDARGRPHDVWLLDGVTAFNQARTALATRPAALVLWRLGLEDPSVWASFGRGRLPDGASVDRLRYPPAAFEPAISARGDALAVEAQGAPGRRSANFDASVGLITHQSMEQVPSSSRPATWGAEPQKVIALTFDDGPDDRFTGKILDILHEKSVKATFFVVGRNAVRSPHLIKRLYDEGHDIGNHTFSHPDLRERSSAEMELELNATQRVLESQLAIRSVLFRPPRAYRAYGSEPDAARVLETATRLGYVTVRVSIDPNDWAAITADQIQDRVISQAMNGVGRVALLHDGGGNRSSTVSALPNIIEHLRAHGYRFVTTHELLDRPRGEIMPVMRTEGLFAVSLAHITWAGVLSLSWISEWLPVIAIVASILGVLRLGFIIAFAYRHKRIEERRNVLQWRPGSLSVLVPAYNEEKVICKTIESLLNSHYTNFDIIVIDDGSSDRTAETARLAFSHTARVKVFRKENGGKAAALNFGLGQTDSEIVVAIDADTVFADDSIELLVRHFADPSIGAVAGTAVVGNQVTVMARFQALEYVTSQNLDRRAFERFNAIGVVPGAIGAWRREALLQAGGYSHDTLAEDADITVAIERRGWRVLYEPRAVAFTEAPERLGAFLKQRFRWMFGTLQVAFKHAGALAAKPQGVALITLPNILVFQFAFTLLAPLMDAVLLLNLLLGLREWLASSAFPDNLSMVARYWLLFQTVDALSAAVGMALDGRRDYWRLLPLVFLQRFSYRQLLYFVAIRTLFAAIKGRFVGWGKLLRTGNVTQVTLAKNAS
jgi:cellulose synthase/poly-beta-1,6-N-acetylglucosamine synthase-like glycosyltransferase/peptidoglycan/xylan/chitin deacetylase (PgdA/CDA1 family)/spore germination protein YaaH